MYDLVTLDSTVVASTVVCSANGTGEFGLGCLAKAISRQHVTPRYKKHGQTLLCEFQKRLKSWFWVKGGDITPTTSLDILSEIVETKKAVLLCPIVTGLTFKTVAAAHY